MPGGNDCPACGRNIGVWAVFRAPLPNRIYCPHCGERLRYGGAAALIAAAVAFVLAWGVAGMAAVLLLWPEPLAALALWVVVFVAGFVPLEVAAVLALWYGGYRLEPVSRAPEWDHEEF
jgi:uncharacterized protein (DUF983 family)